MKIDVIESTTISISKDEKSSLMEMVKIAKKIKDINLDSNNALEDLDEIKNSKALGSFIETFSCLIK